MAKEKQVEVITIGRTKKTEIIDNKPDTSSAVSWLTQGNSYRKFTGGFKVPVPFDQTTNVPIDVIDFGKDEEGVQIYKTWEESFLFFEINSQRYVYSCKIINGGKNYIDLEAENLLAMAGNFLPANCLSIDDFTAVYREYNESLAV
jgi:hypothetical protein